MGGGDKLLINNLLLTFGTEYQLPDQNNRINVSLSLDLLRAIWEWI